MASTSCITTQEVQHTEKAELFIRTPTPDSKTMEAGNMLNEAVSKRKNACRYIEFGEYELAESLMVQADTLEIDGFNMLKLAIEA